MFNLDYWEKRIGKDDSLKYWTLDHLYAVFSMTSFREMGEVALEMVRGMPQPVEQVCGPISSGGYRSIRANVEAFDATIRKLTQQGRVVFNQMPFEAPMQHLRGRSLLPLRKTKQKLLNDFYLPLFESGLVVKINCIDDWKSSSGARWEHWVTGRNGIERVYLPKGFHLD